jgi:hypothetical protein
MSWKAILWTALIAYLVVSVQGAGYLPNFIPAKRAA